MPKPVAVSIDVPHDPETVFEFLDVMANHEPFNDHLMRNWVLSGPERGVGSRARVTTRALGMSDVVDIEVVDAETPVRIVERNTAAKAGRTGEGTYVLAALPDGGTRITFEYRWIVTPSIDRLTAPLARAFIRRNNVTALRRLAEQLDRRHRDHHVPNRFETDLPHHLMGIWPHPDDEAYLSAGLMARMADAGRGVTVITLTRGEKGTSDPADFDQPHFAERRERELRASLAELGVDDVTILDYRDGECDLVDDEAAIAQITEQIDAVRPDMVITFGPDGITGHRDHRTVSAWVTEAWRRVGHGELLYATMSDEFVAENAEFHERIGLFTALDGDGPASYRADQITLTCDLSDDELDRKRRALGRHASQTQPLAALMGEDTYRTWWRAEWFRRPTTQEAATCVRCPPAAAERRHFDEVSA
jgi:LmbE family N-acetylglucosaminyl deacetylase